MIHRSFRTAVFGLGLLVSPAALIAQGRASENPHGPLAQPCAVCHSPEAWVPARVSAAFDHGKSGFPLAGAHAVVACRSCHATLDFRGVSRDCVSCHVDPHRGELGIDCARCHTARSFLDRSGMTRAHQLTRFPLSGAHLTVDCEACHTRASPGRLTFVARSTECTECHLKDYQTARDPDHAGGGFSRDCVQCHATVSWFRTRFDHDGTAFRLTGAHLRTTCSQCHGDGVYDGKSTLCASCHQADYDRTANPPHLAAQFPTDCVSCHTTVGWTGATFDHDGPYFPIYSGAHRGKWTACSTCHINASDYRQFSCLSCHQHDQASMDEKHAGRAGYAYDSQACYRCHPDGRKP